VNKKEFPFSIKIKPDVKYSKAVLASGQVRTITFTNNYNFNLSASVLTGVMFPLVPYPRYRPVSHSETPRARARKWAIENAKNNWCVGSKYIYFSNKTDAALFTIFWENDNER